MSPQPLKSVSLTVEANVESFRLADLPESIKCNFESSSSGRISGWVVDEEYVERESEIGLFVDGEAAGTSMANIFRKDLAEAGIGDGCCAFDIAISDEWLDGVVHEYTVVDLTANITLGYVECESLTFASSVINSFAGDGLAGAIRINSSNPLDTYPVQLLVDGKAVCEFDSVATTNQKVHAVNIELPAHLYDDNFHVFSLQVDNKSTTADPSYKRLNSIKTHWNHISGSYANMNTSALSKISAYRYSALQTQFRNVGTLSSSDDSSLTESLDNIQLAHDIVAEGFQNRKKFPKLRITHVENPRISIVLPVHNQFEYTYNCVASLILAHNHTSFEVILVDDKSDDKTTEIDNYISGIKIIKNDVNLGFLRTAEAGANTAAGDYILFLNNDTEVTVGWLDNLIQAFEQNENVGLAGSKLIYPNGDLQEAGGLVWGNGKPWNIGNGANAEDPSYNYVRHTDYVSGAAMMISKEVWKLVGGFSKEYVPAYYEDTDLAFKVRDAGYQTLYVPASVVVHYEGMSNGRDLDSGYKKYQNVNAPKFRSKWRHAFREHGTYGKNIEMELDRGIDFRVLLLDHDTPKPDQDAGSYAAVQEMKLLQKLGCKITFVSSNLAHMGKYTTALQDMGVECLYTPFYRSTHDVLQKRGHEFDLVYIIRYSVAESVLKSIRKYTKAKVVLNNCDLHFLREMRAANLGDSADLESAMETRSRELEVIDKVDAVLSYNDTEHSVISSHTFDANKIFKCPWVLSNKEFKVPFAKRNGFAFLGSYNHLPNREAVEFVVKEVMPLLRAQNAGLTFHVYGSSVTQEIEALACDDVVIEGFVDSLDTLFDERRVFIAPLLSGAGIKGKVLESVSYQVPCVLSPVAAESTGLIHELNSMIATTPEEWASSIMKLYTDEETWKRLSAKALELVDERYSTKNGLEHMANLLSFLELDPSDKRTSDLKKVA